MLPACRRRPTLAIIATPGEAVPGLVAALGARGTKAAVVITAGFGEGAVARGQALRQAVTAALGLGSRG